MDLLKIYMIGELVLKRLGIREMFIQQNFAFMNLNMTDFAFHKLFESVQ